MVKQPQHVEVIAVPLAICTLMVDGKRLSPSIFKQIVPEPLIDEETGQGRGEPIGWINIHQRDCPEYQHWHVVWMQDGHILRVAIVTEPTESERYLEKRRQSLSLRSQLTDLLAYSLALESRYEGSTFANNEQRTLKIGSYTLPVSTHVAHLLDALEEARACVDREQARWESHHPENAEFVQALAAARQIKEQLERQQIRLAHPALYNHRDKRLSSYARTGDDEETQSMIRYVDPRQEDPWLRLDRLQRQAELPSPSPKRPKKGKWFVSGGPGEEEHGPILWYSPQSLSEEKILAVELQIAEQASALAVFLALQTVERDLQAVHEAIDHLKNWPHDFLASSTQQKKPTKPTLGPKSIFALIQQEQMRFEAYTQGWYQMVADLQASEQLFILT